jgi:long-chain acyl-CoA synthetase
MNFLENIFERLRGASTREVLQETRDGRLVAVNGGEVLALVRAARAFLRNHGLRKGDRCALLAPNSIRWTAADLAIMAEGLIAVPLYSRQAPQELVRMMQDCSPRLIFCSDAALRQGILSSWQDAPPAPLFDEVFSAAGETVPDVPVALAETDAVKIIYTSGTSGEPKGVVLNVANVTFMLGCTNERLDALVGERGGPDRVFHYLPCCFAGSWILLLTCLTRTSTLAFSTDLTKLSEELKLAAPDYFLNVPVLLERVRAGIEDGLRKKSGLALSLFERGKDAWFGQQAGRGQLFDALWMGLANAVVFPAIRKKISPNLQALICGSAPLAKETQQFFMMLGIPVLQVYGLTETTAICTMDYPGRVKPGRVGYPIPGIEMRPGEGNEILVRGPNVFPGYWNRPEATAATFLDGWFRTGDQGEVDADGNWSIIGRVKNLIVLASGHNVAPEPIEEMLSRSLPAPNQVMLVGHGRGSLAALVTGGVAALEVEKSLAAMNQSWPHYRRVHFFRVLSESFTIENGLLTANGKLKRDAIAARFRREIEDLYAEAEAKNPTAAAKGA